MKKKDSIFVPIIISLSVIVPIAVALLMLFPNVFHIASENYDFSSFCKESSLKENNTCEVYSAKWELNNDELIFTIKANRYLHHMVRFIVGTMIEVARGKLKIEDFKSLLHNKKFNNLIIKAPPQGLFLNHITYG